MLCSKAQDISVAARADELEPQESTRGCFVVGMLRAMCSSESARLPIPVATEGNYKKQCKRLEEGTSGGSEHQFRDDAISRDVYSKDAVIGRSRKSP